MSQDTKMQAEDFPLNPAKLIELFGNQTQSTPIELNRMIEFDWVQKLNQIEPKNLCESSIGFDF